MSSDEKLTPERAIRLLRAKAGELENGVLRLDHWHYSAYDAAADIALIAQLLADFMEYMKGASISWPSDQPLPLATQQRMDLAKKVFVENPPPSWPVENQP